MINIISFAERIVEWYLENKRPLPWRETTDPYKIWLSEIILQQTRVSQGLPYYHAFVNRFPDVASLAGAAEKEVLRLWQGLGYYSRARNLHQCAKMVIGDYNGKFPGTFEQLLGLPGIGAYTAAAISSLAFKEPVAVVDGNVFRLLSRVFGIQEDISSGKGKKIFFDKAQSLVPGDNPGTFNQAMMEFGALHCTPQNPKCETCIFAKSCVAYFKGWQDQLPLKTKKASVRRRYFYYFVIQRNNRCAFQRRSGKDIWHGLYDFYLVETRRPKNPEVLFRQDEFLSQLDASIVAGRISGYYRHVLTHQQLMTRFVPVKLNRSVDQKGLFKSKQLKFYSTKEINQLPKPVLVSRYLTEHLTL